MRRRTFLRTQLGLIAASLVSPARILAQTHVRERRRRSLVVVELSGGNDALNTLVPRDSDIYRKARPKIAHRDSDLHPITERFGLAPILFQTARHFREGRIAILPAVGYRPPDRSHFRSMDIWHTAIVDRVDLTRGFLARCLRGSETDSPLPFERLMAVVEGGAPKAFNGAGKAPLVFDSLESLELSRPLARVSAASDPRLRQAALAIEAARDASGMVARAKTLPRNGNYPETPLGRRFETVGRLLRSGFEGTAFWVRATGYDTHAAQPDVHRLLLRDLDLGLGALLDDLVSEKLDRDVTVVVFSEFGRRLAENSSRGTDHGSAGVVIVAGGGVRGGIQGDAPELSNLEDGDIAPTIDFRAVYADLLGAGFSAPESAVSYLGEPSKTLVFDR